MLISSTLATWTNSIVSLSCVCLYFLFPSSVYQSSWSLIKEHLNLILQSVISRYRKTPPQNKNESIGGVVGVCFIVISAVHVKAQQLLSAGEVMKRCNGGTEEAASLPRSLFLSGKSWNHHFVLHVIQFWAAHSYLANDPSINKHRPFPDQSGATQHWVCFLSITINGKQTTYMIPVRFIRNCCGKHLFPRAANSPLC